MFRGLLVRNSEVGAASIVIESIMIRFICGNHMLWGAVMDKSFRRRHVGDRALIETMRTIGELSRKLSNRPESVDVEIVQNLINREIAHTKDAVVDELRKMGATKEQAESAYDTCERLENASPRSFWGIAQGLTRNSQTEAYQDDRFALDLLASQVLRRGSRVLAA